MLSPVVLLSLLLSSANALSSYAPVTAACPNTPLVRPAQGLSQDEQTYRDTRKGFADTNLKAWLTKTNPAFNTTKLPTVALSISGGGYRALLSGAGVLQGLDSRDSAVSTSGLFQSLTYHTGLSGGSWLLSSFAGNNWPTITSLKQKLWEQAFQDSLADPKFLLAAPAYLEIVHAIVDKGKQGFRPTLTDVWGRLLSYQLLPGLDAGAGKTLSSLTTQSSFTSHSVPFPIITSRGARTWEGECGPNADATQYEFTPFEFGSWDNEVSAFTQTKYLGTAMNNGKPTGACTSNYDNMGYILGTSSNLFGELCKNVPTAANSTTNLNNTMAQMLDYAHEVTTEDEYATYRNPFFGYKSPSAAANAPNTVATQSSLNLVDGGLGGQNNPIWPLIQPARNVDVIIVNDNSNDTPDHYPSGTAMFTTYQQAQARGLTRVPFIPPVATFLAQGLNKRPVFFGCNETAAATIVYLPNTNDTFASGESTLKLEYKKADTDAMIANGVQIANQNGKDGWGTCMGCAIMMKTGDDLPAECKACFTEYCYGGAAATA